MPGDHSFVLAEDVLLQAEQGRFHAKISVVLQVREHHYSGPLPIKIVGFRDEQEGLSGAKDGNRIHRPCTDHERRVAGMGEKLPLPRIRRWSVSYT